MRDAMLNMVADGLPSSDLTKIWREPLSQTVGFACCRIELADVLARETDSPYKGLFGWDGTKRRWVCGWSEQPSLS